MTPGDAAPAAGPAVRVTRTADAIDVDTGPLRCTLATAGDTLGPAGRCPRVPYVGPVRTVVKFTGTHFAEKGASKGDADDARSLLPFVVRLYFYAGSDVVRVVHSFVFDVPMHDRHVRFVGTGHGLFAEAVRGITGVRRDPGPLARAARIDGKSTPADTRATAVSNRVEFIPAWGDYTLSQLSADGFQIRKRTKAVCGWAAAGRRAAGVGYVGGASGGVSFGVRDFWQKHPARLDVRNAAADKARVTLWLYSPEAPAMDLRVYHDVTGMEASTSLTRTTSPTKARRTASPARASCR